MANTRVKNSLGIWAFGPNVTRFVPPGYHPQVTNEDMVTRTRRVVDGLADVIDGLEYHYPGEINEDIVDAIKAALGPMDIYCLAAGLHPDPTFKLGVFINPDKNLRRKGIDILKRGVDLAAALGTHFIIWPGAEGYNYNFQRRVCLHLGSVRRWRRGGGGTCCIEECNGLAGTQKQRASDEYPDAQHCCHSLYH